MSNIQAFLGALLTVVAVDYVLYRIPYQLKKGWDSGANDVNPKKKKVCDLCFRDIEKINQAVKERL